MLRGLSDLTKMGDMLKKVMELKGRMEEMKEHLAGVEVEAEAGAGLVKVVMSGKMELLSVTIEPGLEVEVTETLVRAAVNDAIRKTQDVLKSKMSELTGGIDLPGLSG